MEPFDLKVHQVNFEDGDLRQENLDSFGTVVNYDSHFTKAHDGEKQPSVGVTAALSYNHSNSDKKNQPFRRPRTVAQPSKLKSTQIYSHSVCSNLQPSSDQQLLINPHHSFTEADHSYVKDKVSHSDIRTLFQVSSNTTASKKKGKKSRMADASQDPQSSPQNGGQAFETVAEALHLQWSVIGDKKVTPASPEVVAQIVAEAEKRLKVQAGTKASDQTGSTASVQFIPTEGLQSVGSENVIPVSQKSMQSDGTSSSLSSSDVTDIQNHPSQNSAILSSINNNSTKDLVVSNSEPDVINTDRETQLVRMPVSSVTTLTEKTKSWFGSKSDVPKGNKPLPIKSSKSSTMSDFSTLEEHNVQSVSSAVSKMEAISDTDKFLKSLPPYNPIDINDILPQTHVTRSHSPPVKETSFKLLQSQGQGQYSNDPILSSNIAGNPSWSSLPEARSSVTHMVDSGLDIDMDSAPSSVVKPSVLTSTPKKSSTGIKSHIEASNANMQTTFDSVQNERDHFNKRGGLRPPEFASTQKLNEILREKAKLEGQLEMLTHESQVALQERSELQSQIVMLKQKLKNQADIVTDEEKQSLKSELDKMRNSRSVLEQSMASAQKFLEEKVMEAKILQEDLQITQDANDKLQMRMKELRDEIRAKEMTIQALKNKIAELYVEVQTVMQTKMEADNEARGARSDLTSLVNAKLWYQQQLQAANETKSTLQQELTTLQSQVVSHGAVIERLKTENSKIRHQLKETQQKAIKDKEMLAKHLETIESDMMERETAFQEIQRERTMLEGTFDSKLETVEQERIRFQSLYHVTNDLENQLDRAQSDLKKKQSQIFALENEQIDLMKKLTLSQECVIDKERIIEELQQKLIGVEEELRAFQTKMAALDSELWKLKEEKAVTEISLKAALEEKASVDSALENLKNNMGKVEKSFRQMKLELNNKSVDYDKLAAEKLDLQAELDKVKSDIEKEKRNEERSDREKSEKEKVLDDLQLQKVKLESKITDLEGKIEVLEKSNQEYIVEKGQLDSQIIALESEVMLKSDRLRNAQIEIETNQKTVQELNSEAGDKELANENEELKVKIQQLEENYESDINKQKMKVERLNLDLESLQGELTQRQATFETNVELLSSRLRELSGEKEKLETELDSLQRKFDYGMLEKQDAMKTELQGLVNEIEHLKHQKQSVEMQLFNLQKQKDAEIQELNTKLSFLESEIHQVKENHLNALETEELNEKLMLELEKEKGKVEGLLQTNASLKQHISQLETSTADHEANLAELQQQIAVVTREKEESLEKYECRVRSLEEEQKNEGNNQRELRKQIGTKITENKKLKRHLDTLKAEKEGIQQDLEQKVKEAESLQADLDGQKVICKGQTTALSTLDTENKELHRELERVKLQLADNLVREPIIQEQIQSLEWQLSQKCREVEAIQSQMDLVEQRQQVEADNLRKTIEENQNELETLRVELATLKQEKMSQQAQASELRTTLKASIQHHKLTERINKKKSPDVSNSTRDMGTQVEVSDIIIPPLPFDLEAVEKLIQNSSVKALESKPLDNLQSCLNSLRSEISGLQKQVEVHTTSIQSTTQSWSAVEMDVHNLKDALVNGETSTHESMGTISLAAANVDKDNTFHGNTVIDI